jgi:diguanylate cyclase
MNGRRDPVAAVSRSRPESGTRRAAEAEQRCSNYRRAFLGILEEPFTDLDQTVDRLLEVLAITLDVDNVSLWTFEEDAIRCTNAYRRQGPVPIAASVLAKSEFPRYFAAISSDLTLAAEDASSHESTRELDARYLRPLGIRSMMDVPVRAFGRLIGILCHEETRYPRRWSLEDQNFASAVAMQVALAHERSAAGRAQARLLERSLYDAETGLPNAVCFENAMAQGSAAALSTVHVVLASVDQYDLALGILGEEQIALLLKELARRLSAHAPDGACVARTGANEFAMLALDSDRDAVLAAIESWREALHAPFVMGDQRLFATISVGYGELGDSANLDAKALMTEARLAATEARRSGGDCVRRFSSSMRERVRDRASLEQDLRRALEADQFVLHFQPVVELGSGQCVSVEALLRWQHPGRGLLLPSEFLGVAIECGAMIAIGRWALRAACHALRRLRHAMSLPLLTVSVNMCAPEILLPGTAEAAQAALSEAGLAGDALTIEITETVLLADVALASRVLRTMREAGIRVGLDDFGTGFSSLSWLLSLPIDAVKIDRSFVSSLPGDWRSAAIVRALTDLGRCFGQQVVAEGIDSRDQLSALMEMGLPLGQGYLFAAPAPVEQFTPAWLAELRARSRQVP